MPGLTYDRLLADALRTDPSGPFLTFYDDATGERVELSLTTLANWVAKTANLLVDEFDLEPGESVGVALPPHWQTAVVLLAVGVAGGVVTGHGDGSAASSADGPRIAFYAEGDAVPDVEEKIGLGLRPLGGGMREPVPGVLDYAREVPTHGDTFVPTVPAPVPAVDGLTDRLLTTSLDPLVALLVGGGSLVLCRHPAEDKLADRAATERATASWGVDVDGLPRRDRPTA